MKSALFPSKYVHIGGDECPKVLENLVPKCQKRIQEIIWKMSMNPAELFYPKNGKYLNSKAKPDWLGRNFRRRLKSKVTVMSWQGEAGGIAAAQQHHDVVMCPESHDIWIIISSTNTRTNCDGGFSLEKGYIVTSLFRLPYWIQQNKLIS